MAGLARPNVRLDSEAQGEIRVFQTLARDIADLRSQDRVAMRWLTRVPPTRTSRLARAARSCCSAMD